LDEHLDSSIFDILEEESNSAEDYPSRDLSNQLKSTGCASTFTYMNFGHGSLSSLGKIQVISLKSPLITISTKSDVGNNANLAEVSIGSDALEDDSNF